MNSHNRLVESALIFVLMLCILLLARSLIYGQDDFGVKRDPKQVELFRKTHACPATDTLGMGACPGWVVDHYIPLCAGGPDAPSNMRWEEYKESLIKDNWERALCAFLKKQPK